MAGHADQGKLTHRASRQRYEQDLQEKLMTVTFPGLRLFFLFLLMSEMVFGVTEKYFRELIDYLRGLLNDLEDS